MEVGIVGDDTVEGGGGVLEMVKWKGDDGGGEVEEGD